MLRLVPPFAAWLRVTIAPLGAILHRGVVGVPVDLTEEEIHAHTDA
jgi:hypothetical protein